MQDKIIIHINAANGSLWKCDELHICENDSIKSNFIHEENKSRLNSSSACHHMVQKLVFARLLSEQIKIYISTSIIIRIVLYGCKTWSLD
jgi:hypothetical protein